MRIDLMLVSIAITFVIAVHIAHAANPTTQPATQPTADRPSPDLSPQDVVRVVCNAMKDNTAKDEGIAKVFAFASPENRKMTGPLERFIPMVKTPAYAPMLNCKSIELGPGETVEDVTQQSVKITAADGSVSVYVFILSKQTAGEFKDCWMTDAVMPVRPSDGDDPAAAATERV